MSEENVSLLEEISSSEADTESVVGTAGTNIAISQRKPCRPEEKVVVERSEKSPGRILEQFVFGGNNVSDEEVGTGADIEDEDVGVVRGAPALAISGFESEGFTVTEIVRRKKIGRTDFVWRCCWHRLTSVLWVFKSSQITVKLSFRITCRLGIELDQASYTAFSLFFAELLTSAENI